MKPSRSGLILAWLLIAAFGASVASGGSIVSDAFDWQTVIVSFDPVFSTLKAPMLTAARQNGNETAAIGAMRTVDTSQNQYRESNYEGGSSLSYSTELTDLGATTTVTFAAGIELPLTVDDLIIQSFAVDIFALQFDTAGDPVFDTASVDGETFPILEPIALNFSVFSVSQHGVTCSATILSDNGDGGYFRIEGWSAFSWRGKGKHRVPLAESTAWAWSRSRGRRCRGNVRRCGRPCVWDR